MKGSRFSGTVVRIQAGAGGGGDDGGCMPQARNFGSHFLQMESQVRPLEVSDAKRLKSLEDENGKLKKLLAEAMLDIAVLKDINSRKW